MHRGAVLSILLISTVARADRVVGFRVRGPSKVTERTLERLSHLAIGDEVEPRDLPRIQEALLSSELRAAPTTTVRRSLQQKRVTHPQAAGCVGARPP